MFAYSFFNVLMTLWAKWKKSSYVLEESWVPSMASLKAASSSSQSMIKCRLTPVALLDGQLLQLLVFQTTT